MLSPLAVALRRAGTVDGYLVALLAAWTLWVLCSMLWAGSAFTALLPYLGFPLAMLGGVLIGRLLSQLSVGMLLPAVLAVTAGVVLLAVPFYANAQAAWGLQLLACEGLIALRCSPGEIGARRWGRVGIALGMLMLVAVLLVARAQATSLLVVPFASIALCAVMMRAGPARTTTGFVGLTSVGVAAVVMISLASLPVWPEAMNAGSSLSSARHQLWQDALELWRETPLTGAGPGSFVSHSELAASDPLLERAHSSILQVGAELGTVGVVLFLSILVAGAGIALRGSKPAALIGVAAWSVLGVHSMIDHLYEYPVVTLTAGIVLGWAARLRGAEAVER